MLAIADCQVALQRADICLPVSGTGTAVSTMLQRACSKAASVLAVLCKILNSSEKGPDGEIVMELLDAVAKVWSPSYLEGMESPV